jgi:micrococcal nuclease
MYEYNAEVIRVIDADTIKCRVDVGFYIFTEITFRLEGINASDEKQARLEGRIFLHNLIHGETVRVFTEKTEKYGRWLATVYLDHENINQLLLENGLAVPYDGGKRE